MSEEKQESAVQAMHRYRAASERHRPPSAEPNPVPGRLVAEAEARLGMSFPEDLKRFWLTWGAAPCLLPALDEPDRAGGLVSYVNELWGGRFEFDEYLSAEERERLEKGCCVIGCSAAPFAPDDAHYYLVYLSGRGFATFLYHQDYWEDEFEGEVIRPVLTAELPVGTFDATISRLVTERIRQLDEAAGR